ncbi:hypothetical protein BJ963_003380 [Leifsonia soli]|uniref:Uncharacterized protein n=1 Tax=Leifsonia soli TaxID=582665 RepID=A0A852T4P7_9MICO|nr:hypothetical protein [Leifsonia soli]NYD75861.1 hypothetical protein [Leifsonia soli]
MLLALSGICFGVLTSWVNVRTDWVVLSKLIGVGWPWAAVGVAAAAMVSRARAVGALLALGGAVLGYYASDLALGVYTFIDFSDPRANSDPMSARTSVAWSDAIRDAARWLFVAVVVSVPLGQVAGALNRTDGWGLLARLFLPIGAAMESFGIRLPSELAVQPSPVSVATHTIIGIAGVVATAVLMTRHLAASTTWAGRHTRPPRARRKRTICSDVQVSCEGANGGGERSGD